MRGMVCGMNADNNRILSLDVFRGITIAAMIIVNNMGDWSHVYEPLRHSRWHGLSAADCIFPFFLFIMGVAIPVSFSGYTRSVDAGRVLLMKIIRRSLILFALGFLLNLVPRFSFSDVRIPGVLQRIAVCYFAASILYTHTRTHRWMLPVVACGCIVLHWLLLACVPVPGFGAGDLSPAGNLSRYIDLAVFGGHTYAHAIVRGMDPEGILGTISAIATTLFGVIAGGMLTAQWTSEKKAREMFLFSGFLVAAGYVMSNWLPLNKSLWTGSYAAFTAGIAAFFLLFLYRMVDLKGRRLWAGPFRVLGVNAITVYVASTFIAKLMVGFTFSSDEGQTVSIKSYLYTHGFALWLDPHMASFMYAFAYLCVWTAMLYVLFRKKIFIRI